MIEELIQRKSDHIDICLKNPVEAKNATTLFECINLIHNAIPELNFDSIDTSQEFLGKKFSAPILIDAITGGFSESKKINENLALAAEKLELGMVVGSQRAGLLSPSLIETYSIVRDKAPKAFIASNIGAAQLVKGFSIEDAQKCIDMIDANAFVIHINSLQELVQPNGEPNFGGLLNKIHEFSSDLNIPVIVKEVGCGISKEVATRFELAGVSAINVSGVGGTSWAAVEHYKAKSLANELKAKLGLLLWDWGIPTAASLIETRKSVRIPLIASGGVRTGLEVAKSIALGASLAGMALPLLKPAIKSTDSLNSYLKKIIFELKSVMFVTGCRQIKDLEQIRYIITGKLTEWLK
jgi:isopentenyl-diphosphate delta-isomerase